MPKKKKDAFDAWRKLWEIPVDWDVDPQPWEVWNGAVDTICNGLPELLLDEDLTPKQYKALAKKIRKTYKTEA